MKKHRPGELDALYFDKLPMRCKEMFFEYYSPLFPSHNDKNKVFMPHVMNMCFDVCNSPIEVILAFALEILMIDRNEEIPHFEFEYQYEIIASERRYVTDILFNTESYFSDYYRCENNLKLVVECDGHKYHNQTKQQVAYDNQRDLDLKFAGYDVLHFSGSQIYNEPYKCAEEVIDYILMKIGKWEKLQ